MPKAYKECVKKVSAQKGVRSAHAICTASNAGGVKQVRKQEAKARKR